MDIKKIEEIIYSKCKVYRKEKENPYPNEHLGLFWQYEMYAHYKAEIELESRSFKGSDEQIANIIINEYLECMFYRYKGSKEEYDLLLSL